MRSLLGFLGFLIAFQCWAVTTVTISQPATAKAGIAGSITLTATVTGPAGTIAWTHQSGPGAATFISPASLSSAYTAPTRSTTSADYVVRATYTNSDGVTFAETHVGAVLVDANDVVNTGASAAINKMLGSPDGTNTPLLRWGATTTMGSYYDIGDRALADAIAVAAIANPPHLGTQLTGTFQAINTGSVGSGGSGLIGTGSNLTVECNPSCGVIVAWNDPVDGAGAGRHWDDCTYVDNTHCFLTDFATQFTVGTNLAVYKKAADTSTYQQGWWMNGSGNGIIWSYYGVDLALYRLFHRSGILVYLTYARQMADYHWQYQIDHGTKGENPRVTNLQGQFLRALDGHPERLPSLYNYAIYFSQDFAHGGAGLQMPHDLIGQGFDARETAYALWGVALGSMADSDPTRHAAYCARVSALVPLWNTWQQPNGYWSENQPSFGGGYTYYAPGSSPWRTDIPVHALQASYDALYDTSATGCNDQALAQTTLGSIQKAANWIYKTGRADPASGGNGGVYFDAEYETLGEIVGAAASGTMSVNLTSNAVTGVGTAFSTDFSGCNGSRYVMFSTNTVYRVVACPDPTHMTIYPAFGFWGEVANLSGGTAVHTDRAYTCKNFAGTVGSLCGDVNNGSRDLSRLVPSLYGWLYWHTGDVTWRTMGDAFFINAFGGPANGPGGLLACDGVGCDGYETDWKGAAPSCTISANPPTPCNVEFFAEGNAFHYLGKNYGQGSGNPAAQTHLAWRVMPPNPRPLPNRQIISGRVINRAVIR